jgi:hypothetical protein
VSATLAGVMAAIALVACRDASGVGRFFQGLAVRWSPSGDHRLQCRDAFGVGLRGTSSFFFGRSRLAERTRRPTFRKQPLRAAFGALTNARTVANGASGPRRMEPRGHMFVCRALATRRAYQATHIQEAAAACGVRL